MRVVRTHLHRNTAPVAVVWLLVCAVGVITFYWLRNQPFFYDANGYMIESKGISDHGLLSKWPYSDIRSYGYPWFLTGSRALARALHHGPHAGVFMTQWPLFVASAWLAANSLFSATRTRLLAFASVAANPLLVVYSAQAFTESVTLSCVLFATAALARAARAGGRPAASAWLVAGAAVSSYAVAVRPGSLLLPVCYALGAAVVLLRLVGRMRRIAVAATALSVLAALVLPLLPQVIINHRHYHSSSPLPTYDLAKLQAEAGMTITRYMSNVSTCGGVGIKIANPNPPAVPANANTLDAVRYYTLTWPGGPEMVLLHLFSGFDPRPFLIDQHDFGARYERVLQIFTIALLFLAGLGLRRAIRLLRDQQGRIRIEVAFLAVVTVVFLGVLATSAAEYRFGAVPLITVSFLAAFGASQRWRPSWQTAALVGAGFVGALLLWVTLSDLVLSSSPIWQQCS